MIVVHHLENSRSQRILWMLEELGAPYEVRHYQRDPATRLAPETLVQVHPLGKSPVIDDGGEVVAETGHIIEHLCDRFDRDGRLSPREQGDAGGRRLKWRYWLHYAEGSAMAPLLIRLALSSLRGGDVQALRDEFVEPQLQLHLNFWERSLEETGWFSGPDFSAADVAMSFPLEAVARGGARPNRPAMADFVRRIQARPAYQRALARGGPYMYATAANA